MQPINQVLKVVDRQRQLGHAPLGTRILDQITGVPEWRPTFAFRLGYPTQPAIPSARRPVEDVQISMSDLCGDCGVPIGKRSEL